MFKYLMISLHEVKFTYLLLAIMFLALIGCSVPNPKMTFGKKCIVGEDSVAWSYVWVHDKKKGPFKGSKENCKLIEEEDLD